MIQADTVRVDVALFVDSLISWIGAVALIRYATVLRGGGQRSPLEKRARFLIGVLGALLFIRSFAWLEPGSVGPILLTFIPVALLPLAATIFIEGLLRRHVPRWMKILATAATGVAFIANLLRLFARDPGDSTFIGVTTLACLIVTFSALGVILLRRDRNSLSRSENALVRTCCIITLAAVPLAITDFRIDLGWPPVRLGTLGALLFCHTLLGRIEDNSKLVYWLADVGRLLGKAALAGLVIVMALHSMNVHAPWPMFVLGATIVIASAVFDRLSEAARARPRTEMLEWLARPVPTSLTRFARELRLLPLTADATLLGEAELTPYDAAALVAAFPGETVVQSLTSLRGIREGSSEAARGADQLTDLLERNGATHVGLVSAEPIRLMVAAVPELPGMGEVEVALTAVVRRAQIVKGQDASMTQMTTDPSLRS